jgi:hypothetical protein
MNNDSNLENNDTFVYEQDEKITKIEELFDLLTLNSPSDDSVSANPSLTVDSSSIHSYLLQNTANSDNNNIKQLNFNQMPNYSYFELLAMYEKERNSRIDLETQYQEKAKESNKEVRQNYQIYKVPYGKETF